MAEQEFDLFVPEQGVSKKFSKANVLKFLEEELAFYRRIENVINQNLQFGQWGIGGQAPILNSARTLCQQLLSTISNGQPNQLHEYVEKTRSFELVIGQGRIGQRIDHLIRSGQHIQAQWLFTIFNARPDNNSPWIEPFRATLLGNPALLAFSDLAASEQTLKRSELAISEIEKNKETLSDFIEEKTNVINDLEDLYRKKLVIEEPANSWRQVATLKRYLWQLWLLIFAGLVIGPIATVIYFWDSFASAISHLTTTGTTISFAGIAAVSLPALLYAWLLKNVSRVLIQTLNLADDAAHRRALAVTYLGLAENPKIQLLEAERAIVLNALFRPIPTQAGDEGPPAGLVDLIRGKHN